MATPIGHILAGVAVGAAAEGGFPLRRRLIIGALLGAAPDLDFIPGVLVGDPSRFHHAASHSLLFVLAVAAFAAALSADRWRWALLAGGAYGSHLLLDLLTRDDTIPIGIPLLWPISPQTFQSPVVLFPRVLHTAAPALSLHNLGVAALEVAILGPLLAAVILHARRRRPGPRGLANSPFDDARATS